MTVKEELLREVVHQNINDYMVWLWQKQRNRIDPTRDPQKGLYAYSPQRRERRVE